MAKRYGARFQIVVGFEWYTTGAFNILYTNPPPLLFFFDAASPCTAGGGGAGTIKNVDVFMSIIASVTMYRTTSGLNLGRIDLGAVASAKWYLVNQTWSLISSTSFFFF